MTEPVQVGIVRELYLYPVKSMAGEALEEAQIGWHGITGDRRYAFVQTGDPSGFPWLTARQLPQMLHYVPRYTAPIDERHTNVQVQTPDGRTLALSDPALAAELAAAYGAPTHLIKLYNGTFDELPLSLISIETLRALSESTGVSLNAPRFRPSIVIETQTGQPFLEDTWMNRQLVFGDREDAVAMRVNERDPRCVMVNIDPHTLEKDANVLRTIAKTRASCLGVYGVPEHLGTIRVGDVVRLAE